MPRLETFWLSRIPYRSAYELMHTVAEDRRVGSRSDTLLLLEHDHVFTMGRRGSDADILLDEAARKQQGIDVVQTDRGGLVTYHGPGQLVAYPILDLGPNASVADYVARLEDSIIAVLAGFGVAAQRDSEARGVWVQDRKIAAIGVHVAGGITTHGLALNVDPDLSLFQGIVPCGIMDKGVTSLKEVTGSRIPLTLVVKRLARALAESFGATLTWPHPTSLSSLTPDHV